MRRVDRVHPDFRQQTGQKRGIFIERYHIIIEQEEAGTRLDAILARRLTEVSRSHIQRLFEQEGILINGEPCPAKNRKCKAGEEIQVVLPDPVDLEIRPENIPLEILYEDEDLMVVNKPRGMVVHPAAGNHAGTLVNAIMYHCGDSLSSINGVIRPGIVHRIDKDTSGLLMVAKNDKAHLALSKQLEDHSITRKYLAIVTDNIREDRGTVDQPIGRDPKDRKKRAVNGISPRRAVTHFQVLERFGQYTLVECRLETGRTHQIRVHMAYIRHPLVGDPLYGRRRKDRAEGQMLHAGTLGFVHPSTGKYMEFTVPPPEEFTSLLEGLRKGSG